MIRPTLLLALVIVAGCASVQVGAGWHPVRADRPEIDGERNPLGLVLVESRPLVGPVRLFGLHVSSLPAWEQGYGLNVVGAAVELRP